MSVALPRQGRSRHAVMQDLLDRKGADADWQRGRVPLYVFRGSEEAYEVGRDAFFAYFSENALGSKRAFKSLESMEREVIEMALGLFRAPAGATGNMTSGGTESIVMAVKACRDRFRARSGRSDHRGNMVLPITAHPAFSKAARLMDIEVRRVAVGADLRADVDAMEQAADADTILLVGSAPSFSFGVIDPIEELGALALRLGIWLHVDACVGGYLAPFVRDIGYPVPEFDLSVVGVASLSADLHKFGFCPKPASTVFYCDQEHAAFQTFDIDEWPSGRFVTSTLVGTRPGGGVAGAWATLQFLGWEGYRDVARRLMTMRDAYLAGIRAIPGFRVWGEPTLANVSFGSDRVNILQVATGMQARGWVPGLTRAPDGLHLMMSLLHEGAREDYLRDLAAVAGELEHGQSHAPASVARY